MKNAKQQQKEKQDRELKLLRQQKQDATSVPFDWPEDWYEQLTAKLDQSRLNDQASGVLDLPMNRRMVMGKNGMVANYARQSRAHTAKSLEYMKQGDIQAAGYFAKCAAHLAGNARRIFQVGFDVEPYMDWVRDRTAKRNAGLL